MALTEDMNVFFQTGDFAVSGTLTAAGTPATVSFIFDEAYKEPDTTGTAIGMSEPTALMPASVYPTWTRNDTLLYGSTTYVVKRREPEEDGTMVRLFLGVNS